MAVGFEELAAGGGQTGPDFGLEVGDIFGAGCIPKLLWDGLLSRHNAFG